MTNSAAFFFLKGKRNHNQQQKNAKKKVKPLQGKRNNELQATKRKQKKTDWKRTQTRRKNNNRKTTTERNGKHKAAHNWAEAKRHQTSCVGGTKGKKWTRFWLSIFVRWKTIYIQWNRITRSRREEREKKKTTKTWRMGGACVWRGPPKERYLRVIHNSAKANKMRGKWAVRRKVIFRKYARFDAPCFHSDCLFVSSKQAKLTCPLTTGVQLYTTASTKVYGNNLRPPPETAFPASSSLFSHNK